MEKQFPDGKEKQNMTLGTRRDRIDAFYRLLHDLPAGPDRDAEIARRSGMTDLDFKWLIADTERADAQADAQIEWQLEQQGAWRRDVIAWLERWDELTVADRRGFSVVMRDFFQRLAAEAGPIVADEHILPKP